MPIWMTYPFNMVNSKQPELVPKIPIFPERWKQAEEGIGDMVRFHPDNRDKKVSFIY